VPRVCTICASARRDSMEAELLTGQPMRQIALRYGVGESAIARHRDAHLSPAIAKVEAERGSKLLNRVEHLITRTEAILTTAEESGKVSVALSAVREMRELLRLLGNASGELDERPSVTVNLLASPEWLTVRARIVAALAPFPDAREAVALALAGADGARPTEPLRLGSSHASAAPSADAEVRP
jgi:hypothetical protein